MEAVTRPAAASRRGAKAAMVPKPNSRLMVKLPSKLRTALTKETLPPAVTNGAADSQPEKAAPAATIAGPAAPVASTNRCCCCCSSSSCSKSADPSFRDPNPLLRQPFNLGSKNVRGLLKSVSDGTPEVKDLILNECDIIFECKACRNLFRSLCNFMDHKRQFCQAHACEKMMIYDPQRIDQETCPRSPVHDSHLTSFHTIEPSDPSHPVASHPPSMITTEVLTNGIQIPASRRARRLDVCIQKLTQDKERVAGQDVPDLILTPIMSTNQAVFQARMHAVGQDTEHVNLESRDCMRDEPSNHINGGDEKSPCADSSESLAVAPNTGSNGANDSPKPLEISAVVVSKISGHSVRCNICSADFVSNKTLRVHMKTLHASKRLIYPCPFCSLTFTQICNATRHMHQVHKKGKLDVKRLRDIVRLRAKVADEVSRSESPEKQESDPGFHEDMDMTPDADRSSAVELLPEPETKNDVVKPVATASADSETGHVCQGCNKFFPRIASKTGHEKVCEALRKPPPRKRAKADHVSSSSQSASRSDDFGFHPFDSIYDNEPLTITAVIKAGLQKVASTKKLKCYECPTLKFKNNVHLIRHAVAHMNQEIFACNNCVYQSLSRADIDSHAATVHGNEPVKGSPSNKIIITPSEIVTIRDEEFSLHNSSDSSASVPQPLRAVSAYNTTRLKSKKRVFKKRVVAKKGPHPQPPILTSDTVPPPPVTLQPILPEPEVLPDLPPPPPLIPQPVPVPNDVAADVSVKRDVCPAAPALISSVPETRDEAEAKDEVGDQPLTPRKLTSIWTNRPKKLRRLVPSLPVAPVIKPFGGQIQKRIRQARKMKRRDVSLIKSHPVTKSVKVPAAADPAIQPLKILIHKGVTSGKKITYAVTSVSDQNP